MRKCNLCGKEFEIKKYGWNRIYCSQSCNYKSWRLRNPKMVKEKEIKDNYSEYHRNYKKEHNGTLQVKSRCKANNHLKIIAGQICQVCEAEFATEKHHEDYNKPLEVLFLCHNCHKQIHLGYNNCKEVMRT